ncbi:MAG: hypothetical protein H0W83_16135, partial [Planctomycetes bacterium]|nr:hypothetical protein [Planctomycetota bacterium]
MVASRIVLVACLPLLLAGLAGSAAGATWTGDGASDRWSDPANWGGAVPAADEDVV